jgi:hypothetical protein
MCNFFLSAFLFPSAHGNAQQIRDTKVIFWHSVMGMAKIAGSLVAIGLVHFD